MRFLDYDNYVAVKKEFKAKALDVHKSDFKAIEHMLRYGYKQKKLLEMPGFSAARSVSKTANI